MVRTGTLATALALLLAACGSWAGTTVPLAPEDDPITLIVGCFCGKGGPPTEVKVVEVQVVGSVDLGAQEGQRTG